jgi:hypothetical protein
MVTVNRVGGQNTEKGSEIYGMSTDTKPIDNEIPNGSIFMEMDTGIIYFYDAETQQWVQPQTDQ